LTNKRRSARKWLGNRLTQLYKVSNAGLLIGPNADKLQALHFVPVSRVASLVDGMQLHHISSVDWTFFVIPEFTEFEGNSARAFLDLPGPTRHYSVLPFCFYFRGN
jgi:hypothetical protein